MVSRRPSYAGEMKRIRTSNEYGRGRVGLPAAWGGKTATSAFFHAREIANWALYLWNAATGADEHRTAPSNNLMRVRDQNNVVRIVRR